MLVPTSSASTISRSSVSDRPTNRRSLPIAWGHSTHGSTFAAASMSTMVPVAASIEPRTVYSWSTVSFPSSSTWLSRKCMSKPTAPLDASTSASSPSMAKTSRRRRRRIPCGTSGSVACHARASSAPSTMSGAAGPNGVGISPAVRTVRRIVASVAQPAHTSVTFATWLGSTLTGSVSKMPARWRA